MTRGAVSAAIAVGITTLVGCAASAGPQENTDDGAQALCKNLEGCVEDPTCTARGEQTFGDDEFEAPLKAWGCKGTGYQQRAKAWTAAETPGMFYFGVWCPNANAPQIRAFVDTYRNVSPWNAWWRYSQPGAVSCIGYNASGWFEVDFDPNCTHCVQYY
jgi:hypothetical protein